MTRVDDVLTAARRELGEPYIFGDEGPDSFDCSGLMQWVFGQVGIGLPRLAREQQRFATKIDNARRLPGDLIFWGDPATHVALYLGDDKMISAPGRGQYVHLVGVPSGGTYGRVPGLGTAAAGAIGAVGDTVGLATDWLGGAKHIVLESLFVVLGLGLVVVGVYRGVVGSKSPLDTIGEWL